MHECKTVTLRTRPLKGRMLSFYLDYYPGYRDKETMKVIRHETLGIYLYADPKNKREQNFNEVMTEKAEAIRCRRFESVVNERYDFFDKYKLKADFLEYFRSQLRKHDPKWEFVYLHFRNFVHENSWSLYTAGSYRTTIRVSTRSCARTCSFRGVSPFLPRGIGEPVGKVWQTGCRNYCCHRAKPCGILRPMHAGQSGCYRNRNAIGRDERQYFGVRPARRNPQLFFRPGLALSRRLVRAGAGSPV